MRVIFFVVAIVFFAVVQLIRIVRFRYDDEDYYWWWSPFRRRRVARFYYNTSSPTHSPTRVLRTILLYDAGPTKADFGDRKRSNELCKTKVKEEDSCGDHLAFVSYPDDDLYSVPINYDAYSHGEVAISFEGHILAHDWNSLFNHEDRPIFSFNFKFWSGSFETGEWADKHEMEVYDCMEWTSTSHTRLASVGGNYVHDELRRCDEEENHLLCVCTSYVE